MADRLPPPPKPSWSRLSKTLAFWIIVILVPVVLFQLTKARSGEAPEIPYSDFVAALERGNVRQVEIIELQDVRGELKAPERIGERDVLRFTVQLPFQASESFAQKLRDQGVPISAKKPRQGLLGIFLTMLAWLVR